MSKTKPISNSPASTADPIVPPVGNAPPPIDPPIDPPTPKPSVVDYAGVCLCLIAAIEAPARGSLRRDKLSEARTALRGG